MTNCLRSFLRQITILLLNCSTASSDWTSTWLATLLCLCFTWSGEQPANLKPIFRDCGVGRLGKNKSMVGTRADISSRGAVCNSSLTGIRWTLSLFSFAIAMYLLACFLMNSEIVSGMWWIIDRNWVQLKGQLTCIITCERVETFSTNLGHVFVEEIVVLTLYVNSGKLQKKLKS